MPRVPNNKDFKRSYLGAFGGALNRQGLCQGREVVLSLVQRKRGWCRGERDSESECWIDSLLEGGDQVG